MITTIVGGPGTFFVTAEDPASSWSDPTWVDVPGVDPDLVWDDQGTCWVHYSASERIQCVAIDDRSGELLGDPQPSWTGTGLQYPEAPHVFRHGDHWYLLIAEGGTARGHAVSVPRPPGTVVLRLETSPGGWGPDVVALGIEDDDGGFSVMAELDGRYLSTEVVGGFTGRVIGMFAEGGVGAFDWFTYKPLDEEPASTS